MRHAIQHSLAALRATGWLAESSQHRVGAPGRTVSKDMFGFLDIVAVSARGTLGVQAAVGSGDVARHLKKFTDDLVVFENIKMWIRAGNAFEIHSWALRGARGKAKRITARVFNVRIGMPVVDGRIVPVSDDAPLALVSQPDIVLADVLRTAKEARL